ncbi:MAG: AAA family ATPase [Gammaproteobacteria bacterium]|nr:AAA family ATPase [Gammaproteobacteria bacterium]
MLCYFCEDSGKVSRHRLARVVDHHGIDPDELVGRLRIFDMTEADPVLYREDRHGPAPTERYLWLRDQIEEFGADVLIVDNASEVYDASEISRPRVREFIRLLSQLMKPRNGGGGAARPRRQVNREGRRRGRGLQRLDCLEQQRALPPVPVRAERGGDPRAPESQLWTQGRPGAPALGGGPAARGDAVHGRNRWSSTQAVRHPAADRGVHRPRRASAPAHSLRPTLTGC